MNFQCTLQNVMNQTRMLELVTVLVLKIYQLPSFEVQSMENPVNFIL